jgi:hypothetical protein
MAATAAKKSTKIQSTSKQTKSETKPKPPPKGDWTCTTCNHHNDTSRKRCSECQGWRGGIREDIRSPIKHQKAAGKIGNSKSHPSSKSAGAKSSDVRLKSESSKGDTAPGDWQCTVCGADVLAVKKRCGKCQHWRGGIRQNIRSPKKNGRDRNTPIKVRSRNRNAPIRVRSVPTSCDAASNAVGGASNHRITDKERDASTMNGDDRGSCPTVQTKQTDDNMEESDDECNLDDVACCLCKCAVDFGDEFFFAPESTAPSDNDAESTPISKVEIAQNASQVAGLESNSTATVPKTEIEDSAKAKLDVATPSKGIDSVGNQEPTQGTDEVVESCQSSPKTVIHPKDESEHTKRTSNDNKIAQVESARDDEQKTSPGPSKTQSDDESEETKPPFQLPRRFYDAGNSLILCDGPEHANRKKNGSQYKCDRAYHQMCHFIPGEIETFIVPRSMKSPITLLTASTKFFF